MWELLKTRIWFPFITFYLRISSIFLFVYPTFHWSSAFVFALFHLIFDWLSAVSHSLALSLFLSCNVLFIFLIIFSKVSLSLSARFQTVSTSLSFLGLIRFLPPSIFSDFFLFQTTQTRMSLTSHTPWLASTKIMKKCFFSYKNLHR